MEENRSCCTNCGTALADGDAFCVQCGTVQHSVSTAKGEKLRWDADIPAGDLLRTVAKVMGVAFGTVFLLLEIIRQISGESFVADIGKSIFRHDPDIYYAGAMIGLLMLLSMIIVWFVYRNGYEVSYGIGSEGVWMATRPGTRKTNRIINGLLFWLSLFSGRPGGMGTAILADAGQTGFFEWQDVYKVTTDSARRIIALKSNWRTLVKLYCTPDNYASVLHHIEYYVKLFEPQRLADAANSPGFTGYARKLGTLLAALCGVALIGQSPLLPERSAVVILGVLVLAGLVTNGHYKRNISYLTAAVLTGLVISMVINAFEPMGDYMIRYYRYDRLDGMPDSARFAASLTGMLIIAVMAWLSSRVKSEQR